MQTEILSNVVSIENIGNQLIIQTKEAEARVSVYSPAVIRICITRKSQPKASFAVIREAENAIEYIDDGTEMTVNTGSLILKIGKSTTAVFFFYCRWKIVKR